MHRYNCATLGRIRIRCVCEPGECVWTYIVHVHVVNYTHSLNQINKCDMFNRPFFAASIKYMKNSRMPLPCIVQQHNALVLVLIWNEIAATTTRQRQPTDRPSDRSNECIHKRHVFNYNKYSGQNNNTNKNRMKRNRFWEFFSVHLLTKDFWPDTEKQKKEY